MPHQRVFPIARVKLTQGMILAGVLAAMGLAITLLAGRSIAYGWLIGVINLLAAAGIAGMALHRARDKRPRLIVDDDGIWYRDWNLPKVRWTHIEDAFTDGTRFSPFVRIDLHEPDRFLASLPSEARSGTQTNRLIQPTHLMIPHGAVEAELQEIIDEIRTAKQSQAL